MSDRDFAKGCMEAHIAWREALLELPITEEQKKRMREGIAKTKEMIEDENRCIHACEGCFVSWACRPGMTCQMPTRTQCRSCRGTGS